MTLVSDTQADTQAVACIGVDPIVPTSNVTSICTRTPTSVLVPSHDPPKVVSQKKKKKACDPFKAPLQTRVQHADNRIIVFTSL